MSRLEGRESREVLSGRLSGRIYPDLLDRLAGGEFPAGRRLSMEALRADYGASKQPLMEAFRMLAADGIVEIVPQVGCRPVVYTPEEVVDFFHVFAASEGAVAAAAAMRRTQDQLTQLRASLASTAALAELEDPAEGHRRYRIANRDFHGLVQAMAGSRMINLLSRRMWDLSDYLINTVDATHGHHRQTLVERHDDHALILSALETGDRQAARETMSRHILRSIEAFDLVPGTARKARTT